MPTAAASLPSSESLRARVRSLPPPELARLNRLLTPKLTPYVPHAPTPPQAAFLLLEQSREVLYGGAAGGGKSDALLMAALQYVDVPGYSALLLRKSFADLARPGALMDRAGTWLAGTAARWNETKRTWTFPGGARLTFGYLEGSADVYAYQGAEYQFVGFDELTQHEERNYRYLFSRLRRLKDQETPVRMRSASNPGGVGHSWVFDRFFISGPPVGRLFIPAKLEDNPFLDRAEYEKSLEELDEVTRRQLRNGDWSAIDRTNAVVPEFTPTLKELIVRRPTVPKFYRPYSVADTGTRDLTVVLYGYLDFEAAKLAVVAEDVLTNPTTREFGMTVAKREAQLWGNWPSEAAQHSDRGALRPYRYADSSLRLSTYLYDEGAPIFSSTEEGGDFGLVKKKDKEAAQNRTRSLLSEQRITISEDCRMLIATMEGATYNERRTDFQRNKVTGHADAWMALVYLARMVDWTENPYPPSVTYGMFGQPVAVRVESPNSRAVQKALGRPKLKPLT